MTDIKTQKEQKNVVRLYGAFGAALIASIVPTLTAALATIILFLGVLIGAYVMRSKADEGSLTDNHTTFIIRTLWIGGLLAVIAIVAGGLYLSSAMDNTALQPCADQLMGTPAASMNAMTSVLKPCFENYMDANSRVILIATVFIIGPVLLYMIVRFTRGLARALGGYRIANPKSWV